MGSAMRALPMHRLLPMLLAAAVLAGCRSEEAPERGGVETPAGAPAPPWAEPLDAAAARIDDDMPGDFGLYVRRLGDGAGTLDRGGDRRWYLSSTIKVPVAIAVLEQVDAGELALDQELVLAETDYVDGDGDLLMQDPGTRYSIATLLLRVADGPSTLGAEGLPFALDRFRLLGRYADIAELGAARWHPLSAGAAALRRDELPPSNHVLTFGPGEN
ncbi:serine hydrolase [Luteimonas salinilitoris]